MDSSEHFPHAIVEPNPIDASDCCLRRIVEIMLQSGSIPPSALLKKTEDQYVLCRMSCPRDGLVFFRAPHANPRTLTASVSP